MEGWTDMTAIAAGYFHTVGLRKDGTVRAVGSNEYGQCNVTDWTDVAAIWALRAYTVAIRKDGTLLCTDPEKLKWLREALA